MMSFVRGSPFHSQVFCPFLFLESMCLCWQRLGEGKELSVVVVGQRGVCLYSESVEVHPPQSPPFPLEERE